MTARFWVLSHIWCPRNHRGLWPIAVHFAPNLNVIHLFTLRCLHQTRYTDATNLIQPKRIRLKCVRNPNRNNISFISLRHSYFIHLIIIIKHKTFEWQLGIFCIVYHASCVAQMQKSLVKEDSFLFIAIDDGRMHGRCTQIDQFKIWTQREREREREIMAKWHRKLTRHARKKQNAIRLFFLKVLSHSRKYHKCWSRQTW